MNYRPNKNDAKIFTRGDITEYFKNSMERHMVTSGAEGDHASNALYNSRIEDSLAGS